MKTRSIGLLRAAGLLAALAAALAVTSIGHADQPANASFETGDLTGWTAVPTSQGVIQVVTGIAPAGTGIYTAELFAGDADVPVTLSQTFNLAAGETVTGWAQFINADCVPFDDHASVTIEDPLATTTTLFSASSCGTGSGPFVEWTFTATVSGNHTLVGAVTNDIDSIADSRLYMDADVAAPPEWVVRAKIGGGNILNENLPEYTPGTWATKNVVVYLDCVAGDSPIDIERKDQAVTFRDGEWYYSTKPTDECVDEAGNVAAPVVDWGPIMVDTKAPSCKVTPSTVYIPRNTTGTAAFTLDFSDATSGPVGWGGTPLVITGGAILNSVSIAPGDPPPAITFDVTMGSSTAGRVEYAMQISDAAGNRSSCKAIVRAK